jgi:hypothetical protein
MSKVAAWTEDDGTSGAFPPVTRSQAQTITDTVLFPKMLQIHRRVDGRYNFFTDLARAILQSPDA